MQKIDPVEKHFYGKTHHELKKKKDRRIREIKGNIEVEGDSSTLTR